jgi:light-regulated signal transduction histidine kinase (bacteriophytochrome)
MIGATQDITNLKENELHLFELNDDLQKQAKALADSNKELEQFAVVASHDLQEPLRMVTSFLTLLEKKYGDKLDESGKSYIDFAVDGAKRMRQIILDLLELSRVGRMDGANELLDLNGIVEEITSLYKKQVEEKNAIIEVAELPVISGYKASIRQIFQNLISNALKYSSNVGQILIKISVIESEQYWQFSVADNGIGISPEYFDKIFVLFQRLHKREEFSGTGIGLAITKKVIESYGGKIWVTSEPGKGSTFYFTIKKSIENKG